jgi:16S rRNA G966 N2-methylase RsmD
VAAAISENLAALGFDGPTLSNVVVADAEAFCRRELEDYDLVLCDPPYRYESWPALLEHLPGSVVVAESRAALELPAALELHRVYRYGTTLVTVARRANPDDLRSVDGDERTTS